MFPSRNMASMPQGPKAIAFLGRAPHWGMSGNRTIRAMAGTNSEGHTRVGQRTEGSFDD
jgi:hypothetical protein